MMRWRPAPVGVALGVMASAAVAVAALAVPRVAAQDDILSHFKYGSVGTEATVGLPYPIWRVLPVLFADKLPNRPGQGYEKLGFIFESNPPQSRPIGTTYVEDQVALVGLNCATCHTGTVRALRGEAAGAGPSLARGFRIFSALLLLAVLPARGDISLAARNAFGTTPINPPIKVGTARPEPSQIQTAAARTRPAASCVSRMLRTVFIHPAPATKTPRGPRAVRGVFTLRNKPHGRPKNPRHYSGRHPAAQPRKAGKIPFPTGC